jgi:thymidylate synthase (FAD)
MTQTPKLKVTFLGCSTDPVQIIFSAFRMCYSRDDAAETWRKIQDGEISHEAMIKFLSDKLGTGHTSPLRQAQFVFVVDNISRAATAQFNRHHVGIERSEMSQRYVDFGRGIKQFVTPDTFKKHPEVMKAWEALEHQIKEFYSKCTVDYYIPQEDARYALPMATISREQFSMGFQAMQQFLDVRLCSRAQKEIRSMAKQILQIMKKEFPELAKRLGCKCWENRGLFCDEDKVVYSLCRWSRTRPHKSDIERFVREA